MAVDFPAYKVTGTASNEVAEEVNEPFELIVTAWNETQAMITVINDLHRAQFTDVRIKSVAEVTSA